MTDDATTGRPHDAVHHEPGLFLHIHDQNPDGFDPTAPHALLRTANANAAVRRTTVLDLDTANPNRRHPQHPVRGRPGRRGVHALDGLPGRIGWPHVSINTLVKQ